MLEAENETISPLVKATFISIGLQQISQSSIYVCRETEASNSIEISSQQCGH